MSGASSVGRELSYRFKLIRTTNISSPCSTLTVSGENINDRATTVDAATGELLSCKLFQAGVAKSVYALDSKSSEVTLMSVRVRPPA